MISKLLRSSYNRFADRNRCSAGLGTLVCLAVLSGLVSTRAVAQFADAPLGVANKHPLIAIQSLPLAASAWILPPGHSRWGVSVDVSNWLRAEVDGDERLQIDGETTTLLLAWRRGLGHGLDLGIEMPLIRHAGGFTDDFIEQWHALWGLPQNGRDTVPSDRLYYRYQDSGGEQFLIDDTTSGLGDLRVLLGLALRTGELHQLSLRTMIMAPSGDPDKLTGSGGWGGSVGLHWRDQGSGERFVLGYELAGGVAFGEPGEVLSDRRRPASGWGSAMLAWRVARWVSLKAQLDGHSAFYESRLPALDNMALQLSVGATFIVGERSAIDIALSEDILLDTAPDVVFHLAWRYRKD